MKNKITCETATTLYRTTEFTFYCSDGDHLVYYNINESIHKIGTNIKMRN